MTDPFAPGPFGGVERFMFNAVPTMVMIVFVIIIVLVIVGIANNIRNARAPRRTVYARIVAKRMEVRGSSSMDHHHLAEGSFPHSSSSRTDYYITLEFENGNRREFLDVKNLYGLVVEGDVGYAAIQGDWIVAFERRPIAQPERNPGW